EGQPQARRGFFPGRSSPNRYTLEHSPRIAPMLFDGVPVMGKTLLPGFLFLVVFGGGSARAEDSILGLPVPRDASRPGAVMLHGGRRVTGGGLAPRIELAGGKPAAAVPVPSGV